MWHELASQRRLQEAQGPVVLEAVEDVPDELGSCRVRWPPQAVERRVLRLGVAAHVDGGMAAGAALVVDERERPGAGWAEDEP